MNVLDFITRNGPADDFPVGRKDFFLLTGILKKIRGE
jgi:hypothetical protein